MGSVPTAEGTLTLTPMEIDAIGEVMNISMGSAATAVSQMLDRVVEITTPTVAVQKMSDVDHKQYEPALLVKIVYTVGLTGSNCMVFRQHDMQMILNTLMGIPDAPTDDFVFDELSISAACEVMNQMMGASATALADFLNKRIDISTPEATVMEPNTFLDAMDIPPDSEVVTITFRLTIKDMVDSEFISVLNVELVKEIISQFFGGDGQVAAPEAPAPAVPDMAAAAPPPRMDEPTPAPAAPPPPPPAAAPVPDMAVAAPPPVAAPQPQPVVAAQAAPPPMAYPAAPPPQQPQYDPAAMAAYQQPPAQYQQYAPPPGYAPPAYPAVDVRPVEFPEFGQQFYGEGTPVMGNNLDLIMNVPLEVSIEIGTTRRKIRDIMNFTSGTVVELDKQAGAPVDIVVNGQLIAHGDVVVIDDNFGVRITEIVGTKDLINSLSEQQRQKNA